LVKRVKEEIHCNTAITAGRIYGRRGPAPKGEYGGKIARTAVLSTRLQPDTRTRLEAAKKATAFMAMGHLTRKAGAYRALPLVGRSLTTFTVAFRSWTGP